MRSQDRRVHLRWGQQWGVQIERTTGEYCNSDCASEDDGSFWRDEEIAGELGGEHCREGTKVFNDDCDRGVVSVDHSGKRYEYPENASRLSSTSRCQMVNIGGRIGTYSCSGGDGITFHILSLKQSTFHPTQIQSEMNWPNNFGATHPTSFHDRTKAATSIIPMLAKNKIRNIDCASWGWTVQECALSVYAARPPLGVLAIVTWHLDRDSEIRC